MNTLNNIINPYHRKTFFGMKHNVYQQWSTKAKMENGT